MRFESLFFLDKFTLAGMLYVRMRISKTDSCTFLTCFHSPAPLPKKGRRRRRRRAGSPGGRCGSSLTRVTSMNYIDHDHMHSFESHPDRKEGGSVP